MYKEISLFEGQTEEFLDKKSKKNVENQQKKEELNRIIPQLDFAINNFFQLNYQNPKKTDYLLGEDKRISVNIYSRSSNKFEGIGEVDSILTSFGQSEKFHVDCGDEDPDIVFRDKNSEGKYPLYLGITSISLANSDAIFYFDGLNAWVKSKKEKKMNRKCTLNQQFVPAWERLATIDEIKKYIGFLDQVQNIPKIKFSCSESIEE